MQNLRRLLPSAGNLIVFEAAGRLESFTRAADELAMTQAAVSYAIRALETQLGAVLFRRAHRAVHLSDAGRRFHAEVSAALEQIRRAAEEIRERGRDNIVTLAGSTAFASMWMLPRLSRFREELPDIDLRIQTSDRDLDLRYEPVQLAIRGGFPDEWPHDDAAILAPEIVEAVASPIYLDRHEPLATTAHLTRHRLIHLEEPHRAAVDWRQWLMSAGVNGATANRGLAINDYVLVIQAVLEGQGIALGWRHLTGRLVRSGLLRKVTEHRMETGAAFYIVWPKSRPLGEKAKAVRDWLIAEGKADA